MSPLIFRPLLFTFSTATAKRTCKIDSAIDEDISTTDITMPPILIQGPITISRARQLKQQVNSFLCSSSCENENRLLPNDVLVLRNEGEGHGVLMEHQGRAGEQGGRAPPVE